MKKPQSINLIYYSPTGTTKEIVTEIAQGLKIPIQNVYNLSSTPTSFHPNFDDNSLTIVGIPTYSGRLPVNTIEQLQRLKSDHSPVVVVVVYGNREFEDSLLELSDIVTNCGFKVIAAAAFIGEHSYSTPEKPIAKGRPDQLDLLKCHEFAQHISSKIQEVNQKKDNLKLPGSQPYKERTNRPVLISPETKTEACDQCGICVDACPTNAITLQDELITNKELCTWCCACIKYCPNEARYFDNPTIDAIKNRLFLNCSARKEPEFFI